MPSIEPVGFDHNALGPLAAGKPIAIDARVDQNELLTPDPSTPFQKIPIHLDLGVAVRNMTLLNRTKG